jgi:hypothetical protein
MENWALQHQNGKRMMFQKAKAAELANSSSFELQADMKGKTPKWRLLLVQILEISSKTLGW